MVLDDEERARQYFHLVFDQSPQLQAVYRGPTIWRCVRCHDLFGESGPGSVRDRNWNIIGIRACPNEIQGDLFKEFTWQET